jgi:hypothetical protein
MKRLAEFLNTQHSLSKSAKLSYRAAILAFERLSKIEFENIYLDPIVTIKKYAFGTQYELARTNEERAKLLSEARHEESIRKAIIPLIKVVHSFDKRAKVRLEKFEDGKPKRLTQEKVSKKASGFSHVDELRSSAKLNSCSVV